MALQSTRQLLMVYKDMVPSGILPRLPPLGPWFESRQGGALNGLGFQSLPDGVGLPFWEFMPSQPEQMKQKLKWKEITPTLLDSSSGDLSLPLVAAASWGVSSLPSSLSDSCPKRALLPSTILMTSLITLSSVSLMKCSSVSSELASGLLEVR